MRAAFFAALLLPVLATAADDPVARWSACSQDSDCVVVRGICNPAAVHSVFTKQASEYFLERAKTVRCRKEFWKPTMENARARCRVERCEIVGKD